MYICIKFIRIGFNFFNLLFIIGFLDFDVFGYYVNFCFEFDLSFVEGFGYF